MNPNKFLAIDPGGKRTGWATFDGEGKATGCNLVVGIDNFMDWLDALEPVPEVVIVESYHIDNKMFNHQGSDVPTLRLIGMIERYCHVKRLKMVKSRRANLKIGLQFMGVEYGKGEHVPDQVSALAHGTYYLVKHRIKKSVIK